MGARRAVLRWAWRLFRHEWRQQITVVALLTVAVALAIGGGGALSGWEWATHSARYGTANQAMTFYRPEAKAMEANLAAAREHFGEVDVISGRGVEAPGLRDWVELRDQDPAGSYSAPTLALLHGAFPRGAGEVAVTDGLARLFNLRIGSRFALAGGTVTGLVENPADLGDQFVLVPPGTLTDPHTVTVLTYATEEQEATFVLPDPGNMGAGSVGGTSREEEAGLNLLGLTVFTMIVVGLIGTAGFLVMAHRRLRQLAMLAAIGATRRHVRLVLIANGAVTGLVASVIGVGLGMLAWFLAAPALEVAIGARLARAGILPWWAIAVSMVITVVAAILAAWWPARTISSVPVASALSGRAGGPRRVRGSAAMAVFLIVTGGAYLLFAGDSDGHWINILLRASGATALVAGLLLLSPLIVRSAPRWGGRMPLAVRLALRDLGRQQARSGAVLAAAGLALGIAVTAVVVTRAAEQSGDFGNLTAGQLLITEEGGRIREVVTLRTPDQVERLGTEVRRLAAELDDAKVIALSAVVDPDRVPTPGRSPGHAFRPAVRIGNGPQTDLPGPLFVATPELLDLYEAHPRPETEVLTARTGDVGLRYLIKEEPVERVERLDAPPVSSAPTSLITEEAMRRRGWVPAHAGWLVVSAPPTPSQLAAVQTIAAESELQLEVPDAAEAFAMVAALRLAAMGAGLLLALTVLAMAVGLVRAETANDLRTLTAVGAARGLRRMLSAATAGSLAVLGVLMGTLAAYVNVTSGLVEDLRTLLPLPVTELLVIIVGVPLAAALTGWLLAGREPGAISRTPIE